MESKENNLFFSSESFKQYIHEIYIVRIFYREFDLYRRGKSIEFKTILFKELLDIDNSRIIHWNTKDLKRKIYCILEGDDKKYYKCEMDIKKRDFKNNNEHLGLSICYLLLFVLYGMIKTNRFGGNYFTFGFDYYMYARSIGFLKFDVRMKKQVLSVEELLTEITKPFNNPNCMCDNSYKYEIIIKYIIYYKGYYREKYLIK